MVAGIVGSEEAKFTPEGIERAKVVIARILSDSEITEVVSGDCHLGGIDQWAAELGHKLKIPVKEFPPKVHNWTYGYKPRNLVIAHRSDVVHCITVNKLPDGFAGMRFPLCYHCGVASHVKSGGCWTMHQAMKLGKVGILHIIRNVE